MEELIHVLDSNEDEIIRYLEKANPRLLEDNKCLMENIKRLLEDNKCLMEKIKRLEDEYQRLQEEQKNKDGLGA